MPEGIGGPEARDRRPTEHLVGSAQDARRAPEARCRSSRGEAPYTDPRLRSGRSGMLATQGGFDGRPGGDEDMKVDFAGKRVIVTGGSRGIGRVIALAFAEAGASLSICGRDPAALAEARRALEVHGAEVHAAACDLARLEEVEGYVAGAAAALGGLDVLVNNASGLGQTNDEAGWQLSLTVDVMATVRASHAALPFLEASGGCVVNISSIASLRPSPRTEAYGAAKAAVNHFTVSEAAALAKRGVRINGVAPGTIEVPGGRWDARRTTDPALYDAMVRQVPFGRLGRAEHVANAVLFLASPWAEWITGQVIAVDGGQRLGA